MLRFLLIHSSPSHFNTFLTSTGYHTLSHMLQQSSAGPQRALEGQQIFRSTNWKCLCGCVCVTIACVLYGKREGDLTKARPFDRRESPKAQVREQDNIRVFLK